MDPVKFTWDTTFVDALRSRNAIEINPESNTKCLLTLFLESPPQFENQIMAQVCVVLCTKKLHFVHQKWRSEN